MEKIHHNKAISSALLVIGSILALALIFTLGYLVTSPKSTSVYGLRSGSVDVSVRVSPSGPPVVDDIGPMTGPTSGGFEITIKGDNLDAVSGVFLGDGGPECVITSISKEEIKCTMPPHEAGYVDIVVEVSEYKDTLVWTDAFRYLADAERPIDGGGLPLPPNTGLFRLGKHIITLYDVLTLLMIVALWAVALWLILWRRSHHRHEMNKKRA